MTREEAIEVIRKEYACVDADCDIERNCGRCELHMPSKEPILKAYEMAIQALSQEPCDDVVSRQAVKVWLEEMDNKLNPRKYNTIAEYYAVKAQMQKLIYICDIPKEKSCLNCKYNNENLYRGEHCGDCDECMLWEQEEQLPSVTQKYGKWIEHPEIETSAPEYLMFYECSECGDKQCFCKSDIHKKRFCNNCGAKMVEPQESEDKG